jgi:hypothetical protein
VIGRVLTKSVDGGDLLVSIGVGSAQGVDKSWTSATVLRAGTTSPLSGGNATIVLINKNTTVVRVHLTLDVLTANDQIRLAP